MLIFILRSASFVVFGVLAGGTTEEQRKASTYGQQNIKGYSLKEQHKANHHYSEGRGDGAA